MTQTHGSGTPLLCGLAGAHPTPFASLPQPWFFSSYVQVFPICHDGDECRTLRLSPCALFGDLGPTCILGLAGQLATWEEMAPIVSGPPPCPTGRHADGHDRRSMHLWDGLFSILLA